MDGSTQPQCSAPTILYENGALKFRSTTEGVTCHHTITDSDVGTGTEWDVELSLTYQIKAYATKEGYTDSEVTEATLCWIDCEPRQEGTSSDMSDVKDETLADLQAKPVIISSCNGILTISGADDGTQVTVYDPSGALCGSAITLGNQACISTTLPSGSIAIVKVGEKSLKVRMR